MSSNKALTSKQNKKNNKGFTLVEIIVVIVIIAILAAIFIPSLTRYIDLSREKADLGQLGMLNRVTQAYRIENADADPFLNADKSSVMLMGELVAEKFLSEAVTPKLPGASFEWAFDSEQWVYVKEDGTVSSVISHVFGEKDLSSYKITHPSHWTKNPSGFYSSYGILFIPNLNEEYTITSKAKFSGINVGGYGVLFESTLFGGDKNKDTGYIFQFDRGLEKLVVKKRAEGKEVAMVKEFNTSEIPEYGNNDWWTAAHEIKLKVSSAGGAKELVVSIDGKDLEDKFSFTPDSVNGDKVTGLRAWGAKTEFNELTIE